MTNIFTPATEIEIAELLSLLSGLPVAKDIVRKLATQRDMLRAELAALRDVIEEIVTHESGQDEDWLAWFNAWLERADAAINTARNPIPAGYDSSTHAGGGHE